jgi:hypothetical protein
MRCVTLLLLACCAMAGCAIVPVDGPLSDPKQEQIDRADWSGWRDIEVQQVQGRYVVFVTAVNWQDNKAANQAMTVHWVNEGDKAVLTGFTLATPPAPASAAAPVEREREPKDLFSR